MTTTKRLTTGLAGAALAATLSLLSVAPASAAHCADPNDRPGNAEFSDHVRSSGHDEGGHQGWSSCEEQANSDNDNANRPG